MLQTNLLAFALPYTIRAELQAFDPARRRTHMHV
jgi:hypothetical protein